MITFKQYLIQSTSGNYVSLDVDNPEIDLDLKSGTVVPPGKHHVTLMYSEGTDVPKDKIKKGIEWMTGSRTAKSHSVDVFDSDDDPTKGCIVLDIDSDHLHNIHEELRRIGLRHSYQEFKPHVTLAYGVDIDEAKRIAKELNAKLKMEPCLITMKGLVVKPIKDNWSDEL